MNIGKHLQPSIAGTRGGATTLLYVVLIVALWLSITGRAQAVRDVFTAKPSDASGGTTSVQPVRPIQGPNGTWGIGQDGGLHGTIGGHGF